MAKDKFDACFMAIDSSQKCTVKSIRKFTNSLKGFAEFENWSKKYSKEKVPVVFTMEATGVYYEQLAWYLFDRQAYVSVLLANKARQYAKSVGLKSKNDKKDSIALARLGAEQALARWQPLSKDLYQLRGLTRQLESLQNIKTCFTNQLHALEYGYYQINQSIKVFRN